MIIRMIKKIFFWINLIAISSMSLYSQSTDFTGYRFYINPGHGGYDSNDRYIPATGFWESDGNLEKGLFLRELLKNLNATIYMSRTTNTTADDLSLSAIDEMANAANVDFFLSIHSNGFAGTQNQPLTLFRGYDDQPVFTEAKNMAEIIWQKLYEKGNCWTSTNPYVKGDWTFYPDWGDKVGLGVLRTLTMPGVLSEGSFHDYVPESWRLRNPDFLHHESWAFLRSFIEFYNIASPEHGIIAGVIRDTLQTPSWYFRPGTRDGKMPVNGASVTLIPGGKIYQVDTLNNGFFFFDSLAPGDYKLYFDGLDEYYEDSLVVTAVANKTTLADIYLQKDTTIAPELLGVSPDLTDSITFNQEFTFSFSISMDPASVEEAIQFVPDVNLEFTWDKDYKNVKVKALEGLQSGTKYLIKVTTAAASRWNVRIEEEQQFSFATFYRSKLKIEKIFPADGLKDITLYPQVRIYFDAPLNESSASTNIRVLNNSGQILTRKNEKFINENGETAYFFEFEKPLERNERHRISLNAELTDAGGISLGEPVEISFTTRSEKYDTGEVIEPFETISNFWDPEASGSTLGTDNPLTTFTASQDVVFSGLYSGRLNYVFTGSGGVCRVFNTQKPSIGKDENSVFGIWVFGDLSYNQLEYWFYSSASENQIVFIDEIDWAGWDYKTVPVNSIGTSGEIQFHSMVIRQSDTGSAAGTIWFDNATIYNPEEEINDETILFYPNPLTGRGTVKFSLAENSYVSISIFSMDGRKVLDIFRGNLDSGLQEIQWRPTSSFANGLYILRMHINPGDGSPEKTSTWKWVIAR